MLDYTITEDCVVKISVPGNTSTIHIDFNLTDDGDLQITDIHAVKDTPPGGNSPQTGDNSNIYLWMILLAFSGGTLIIFFVMNRRIRKQSGKPCVKMRLPAVNAAGSFCI